VKYGLQVEMIESGAAAGEGRKKKSAQRKNFLYRALNGGGRVLFWQYQTHTEIIMMPDKRLSL